MTLSAQQLCEAAGNGDEARVLSWVESCSPVDHPAATQAIIAASAFNHPACIRILMRVGDAAHNHGEALEEAMNRGHMECVDVLLEAPHSARMLEDLVARFVDADPIDDLLRVVLHPRVRQEHPALGHHALLEAARRDEPKCIAALIPHVDPAADGSRALWRAAGVGSHACLELLLPHSQPEVAFDHALSCEDHAGVNGLGAHVGADRWGKAVKVMDLVWIPEVVRRWEDHRLRQELAGLGHESVARPRL